MTRLPARIAGITGAATTALGLAEVAARALIRRRGAYYRYVPNMRVRFRIDRDALPQLSAVARAEINADGERGGPPPRPDERAYRALVVGGSAAECVLLDQPETWPAVVERVLSQPSNARALDVARVHVGSVARAILPCAHVDALLGKLLPRYPRLDLVLVMVGAADVVSWIERGLPRVLAERAIDLSKLFEEQPEGPWGAAPKSTALWRICSGLQRQIVKPVIEKPGGDWLPRVRAMRARAEVMIDDVPDATPMLANFEEHLGALLETARGGATRVIVVRQPWWAQPPPEAQGMLWNFGLGRPYREEVKAYFTSRVVDVLMRMVDQRTAAVADRLGVEHVNLMPHLEQSTATFYDELHFTPPGAEAVGRLVAGAILARHQQHEVAAPAVA